MRLRKLSLAAICAIPLVLTACSESASDYESVEYASVDIEEAAEGAVAGAQASTTPDKLEVPEDGSANSQTAPVGAPQIAYTYDYGFRIDADEISSLARSHVQLCEKLGPDNCRVISLRQSGKEGRYADGQLELAVAAGKARAFGEDLAGAAQGMGGEQISVAISGEDLSKRIVDTQARLRARTLLRDRLMEVLRSRRGTVAELVEAERGVAQVNEEIDQAQSWLAEMKGRVAFSQVSIDYSSSARTGGSFSRPIVDAFQSIGTILGTTIGALIYAITALLPIAILIFGVRWVLHRFGLRLRFWKNETAKKPEGV